MLTNEKFHVDKLHEIILKFMESFHILSLKINLRKSKTRKFHINFSNIFFMNA